ncbi:MAG TPA: septum site-determining protein MinC [Firmicutes bacterium]|nr:septum site-determining protein MinC [Bacillota bacterium]
MRIDQVVFKGTKDGLLVVIPQNQDIERVKKDLDQKLSRPHRFFVGGKAVLDLGDRWVGDGILAELSEIIEHHGLKLIKVVGPFGVKMKEEVEPSTQELAQERQEDRVAAGPLEGAGILRRTVRSGQRVHAPGNLVILGDVNPGAEVLAGGDIIVVGALRGLAHAGLPSNDQAVVVALRLSPTQLRIANVIARSPDGRSRGPNIPEIARIREGTIVIESFFAAGR